MKILFGLLVWWIPVLGSAAHADRLQQVDGSWIQGRITEIGPSDTGEPEVTLELSTELEDAPVDSDEITLDLAEVYRIEFGNVSQQNTSAGADRRRRDSIRPLIAIDGPGAARVASGAMALRAGLHQVVLPYLQAGGQRFLQLEVALLDEAGREVNRRAVPQDMLFHRVERPPTTEPDRLDGEGFRLADLTLGAVETDSVAPGLRVAQFDFEGSLPNRASELPAIGPVDMVIHDAIDDRVSTSDEQFGLIFEGLIKIPEDGRYRFFLTVDDSARLYIGRSASALRRVLGSAETHRARAEGNQSVEMPNDLLHIPARLLLDDGTDLAGQWHTCSETALGLTVQSGDSDFQVHVPRERLAVIVGPGAPDDAFMGGLSRAEMTWLGEAQAEQDVLLARDRDGDMQRLEGAFVGLDPAGERLVFHFGGRDRNVQLDRVAAVLMSNNSQTGEIDSEMSPYHRVEAGDTFSIALTELSLRDQTLIGTTTWQESVQIAVKPGLILTSVNGRRAPLGPDRLMEVVQTPWFDYLPPPQVIDEPVTVAGGEMVMRGLTTHARTELIYRASGFDRFVTEVALAHPAGRAGDAAVRVLADGQLVFELESLTYASGPVMIDVATDGAETIKLVTDFGNGDDVGDTVVWIDPILLKTDSDDATPEEGESR